MGICKRVKIVIPNCFDKCIVRFVNAGCRVLISLCKIRPCFSSIGRCEAELRALIGPSRKEEGCLTFDLHASVEQPGSYLLHEVWASREAHTEHLHTLHYLRWDARKDALVTFRDGTFWKQIA